MSGHQTATVEDTVYFWFAANDTSGSGGDGATPLFDVREAGAAASAIPLLSGTPSLLSHANYPAGCHEIAVAATAANGFAANDTFAVFCTLAVDAQNPSGFVGSCTLTPLAKATALATAQTSIDDVPTVAEFNARTLVASSYFDPAADTVATVTDLTNLPSIPANWLTATGINAGALDGKGDWALASVLGALNDAAAAGDPTTADTLMQYAKQLINVLVGTAGVGTFPAAAAPGNAVSLAEILRSIYDDSDELQGDWVNGGRLDVLLDAIPTTAMRGTDSAALASEVTSARMSELDAGTAGKMANQVDEIRTDTGEIGPAGAGLTNINLPNQTMDITGDITGDLSGSVGSVTAEVTADITKISGSATAANKLEEGAEALAIGTVNDASATTTVFIITLTGDTVDATDDHYNGRTITFTSGALLQQSTDITDYNGTTKALTVTALTEAPANGVQFVIS